MTASKIDEARIITWIEGLFEEDLHIRRIPSLAHATLVAAYAASLGVRATGQVLADARGTHSHQDVKQVDRFPRRRHQALEPCCVVVAVRARVSVRRRSSASLGLTSPGITGRRSRRVS